MRILIAFLGLLALAPVSTARAEVSDILVRDLVDRSVIPAYREFEEATAALSASVDRACADGALATDAVGLAFAEAWRAWAGARHVVKGPVTYFDRQFRIEFWPDTRNRVARGLSDLRSAGGAVEIADAPVAVQGFPALERLIHPGDGSRGRPGEGTGDCAIARSIAANLHAIAAAILAEWIEGDSPFRTALVAPGTGAGVYFTHGESLSALMTGAISSLEAVVRLRLNRPLGGETGKPRPKRSEAWRSELSMELIRADLAAVAGLYGGDGHGIDRALRDAGETDLADLMSRAFRITLETAGSVTVPLSQAVADPASRKVLEDLVRQVSALKALLDQRVAPALGISAGFNALDGD